jgi:small subunit ribosomal protein S2
MLTNFKTIRSSVKRLLEIEAMASDGTYEKLSKKEVARQEKARLKLEKAFSGIKQMETTPGLVFIVDTKRERIAVSEANRINVPIIGIVDTNCDPDPIDFPIPGNDDAIRAIELYARFVSDTVLRVKSEVSEGATVAPAEGERTSQVQEEPSAVVEETEVAATAAKGGDG